MEDQDYSALSFGGITGVNSNSASVAVAEESSNQNVDPPGNSLAPGAAAADLIKFDRNNDGEADRRRYRTSNERNGFFRTEKERDIDEPK